MRLLPVGVDGHSRPVLLPGELERGLLDKVDLLFDGLGGVEGHLSEEYKGGYAVLTTLRLLWVPQRAAGGAPCALPLNAVAMAEIKEGVLKTPRLKLMVRADARGFPSADPTQVVRLEKLKLLSKAANLDSWHSSLQLTLAQRPWLSAPPATLAQLTAAGAAAVAAQQQQQQQQPGPARPGPPQAGWGVQPDQLMVHELTTMGFPARHAANALIATNNAGVQQALDWLLDHEGSPLLEQPNPYNTQQAQQAQQHPPPGSSWGMAITSSTTTTSAAAWQQLGPLGASAAGGTGGGYVQVQQYSSSTTSTSGWVHVEPPSDAASVVNPLLAGLALGTPAQQLAQQAQQAAMAPGLAPARLQAPRQLSLGSVGVAGVLKREEQRAAQTEHTLEQAFTDLRNLMGKAAEMVQLAERFRVHINRKDTAPDASDSEAEELDAETALDLINLGIVNPVTKETAGKQYEQQLARQLADFLKGPVERFGGLMPLPDVYCLFNRARGAELVSPDDLLAAVKLFPAIGAPFQLREFGSGVKVVQATSHSDEEVCRKLAALVAPPAEQQQQAAGGEAAPAAEGPSPALGSAPGAAAAGAAEGEEPLQPRDSSSSSIAAGGAALWSPDLGPGIGVSDAAATLAVPLAIAGEHLLVAEARGVLCRDDGPEGLRFFRNFFAAAAAELEAH